MMNVNYFEHKLDKPKLNVNYFTDTDECTRELNYKPLR